MRFEIKCSDRMGISQEILAIVAKCGKNVVAMEVVPQAVYLHLDGPEQAFPDVARALYTLEGVEQCKLIDLLPTELREYHLNAMLRRIPDLIFDVAADGTILSTNMAIDNKESSNPNKSLVGERIESLLHVSVNELLEADAKSIEVAFSGKSYIVECTPISIKGVLNGALIVLKGVETIGRHIAMLQGNKTHEIDNIIGQSEKIKLLKTQLTKFSKLDLPILITGETGTGKELFARAIHQASSRRNAPFLAINCASLSEHLLESELFGYTAGAFTGAKSSGKPGLFELANGGTVFLDEVAEMSGYLQAKLLRFLQDYSYRRLGGTKEFTANVRIISASHQPFNVLLENKTFREDLYYRLNVLNLSLPSLAQRRQDIPLLCNHFLENAARQVNQPQPQIAQQATDTLVRYPWPGNIRQLQNVLFRLVALSTSEHIYQRDVVKVLTDFDAGLPSDSSEEQHIARSTLESAGGSWLEIESWQKATELFEKDLLSQFQPYYPSTRKLAERLGVSHNKVAMKLRAYNLKN